MDVVLKTLYSHALRKLGVRDGGVNHRVESRSFIQDSIMSEIDTATE